METMPRRSVVMLYGILVSLQIGEVFGLGGLLAGALVGMAARILVQKKDIGWYLVGIVLGIVFLALVVLLKTGTKLMQ